MNHVEDTLRRFWDTPKACKYQKNEPLALEIAEALTEALSKGNDSDIFQRHGQLQTILRARGVVYVCTLCGAVSDFRNGYGECEKCDPYTLEAALAWNAAEDRRHA